MLAFKFLHDLTRVLRAYFGDKFNQQSLQENFVLIFELLDEVMDFGFPQARARQALPASPARQCA